LLLSRREKRRQGSRKAPTAGEDGGLMDMMSVRPIGWIRTPFGQLEGMPIQPPGAEGTIGRVEVLQQYRGGLQDLDGFSHLILLYWFHGSQGFELVVEPFLDSRPRGLFSTRAPKRPNPIGLSVVELEGIEESVLHIRNVDILDGTPLLDIKPYVPAFDAPGTTRVGWLEGAGTRIDQRRSDDRFG
jgi:tRNA-Thr(GGU) m(6)t(6)A37 methyltransferase TsaA